MSFNTPGNPITVTPDIDPLYTNTVDLQFSFDTSVLYGNTFLDYLIDPVYFWDFGDGEFSFELNPVHKFKTAGDYKVKLYITSTAAVLSGMVNNTVESILLADPLAVTTLLQSLIPSLAQGSFRIFTIDIKVSDFLSTTFSMDPLSAVDTLTGIYDVNMQTEVIPSYLQQLQEGGIPDTTLVYSLSGGFVSTSTVSISAVQGRPTQRLGIRFVSPFVAPYRISLYSRGSKSAPPGSFNPWPYLKPEWYFSDSTGKKISDILATKQNNVYIRLSENSGLWGWEVLSPSQVILNSDGSIRDANIFNVGSIVTANVTYTDDMPATGLVLHAVVDTISTKDDNGRHMFANSDLGAIATVDILPAEPTQLVVNIRKEASDAGYTWTGATTPYVVSIADSEGIILKDYPKLAPTVLNITHTNTSVQLDSSTKTIALSAAGAFGTFKGFDENLGDIIITAQGTVDGTPLSGSSLPCKLLNYDAEFGVRKFNASFDMTSQLLSYTLQETINRHTNLYEGVIKPFMAPVTANEDNALGRTVYERIANFNSNVSSIDTCHVQFIPSLLHMVGSEVLTPTVSYPAGITNLINLWSLPPVLLAGINEKRSENIAYFGANDENLGARIELTDFIAPGESIIAHRKYSSVNKVIQVGRIKTPIFDSGTSPYTLANAIGAYDTALWGMPTFKTGPWGLDDLNNYEFFRYVENPNAPQSTGAINWSDELSTLPRSTIDGTQDADGSIIDKHFDYQLQRGLGLFN